MKMLGFLLLLSGWVIALGAIALLAPGVQRIVFLLSGIGVEVIGLVLFARSQVLRHRLTSPSPSPLSSALARGERE
jgi:hypothetical protein